MPRINLSVSQELYDKLLDEAEKRNSTVNYLVLSDLEEKYSNQSSMDYIAILDNMINESKQMEGDFILADLPTYANIEGILIEKNVNISTASVKARLGKMYNEAVRKAVIPGVERAIIEKNGVQELKFLSRAAVYTKLLKKWHKEQNERYKSVLK